MNLEETFTGSPEDRNEIMVGLLQESNKHYAAEITRLNDLLQRREATIEGLVNDRCSFAEWCSYWNWQYNDVCKSWQKDTNEEPTRSEELYNIYSIAKACAK